MVLTKLRHLSYAQLKTPFKFVTFLKSFLCVCLYVLFVTDKGLFNVHQGKLVFLC